DDRFGKVVKRQCDIESEDLSKLINRGLPGTDPRAAGGWSCREPDVHDGHPLVGLGGVDPDTEPIYDIAKDVIRLVSQPTANLALAVAPLDVGDGERHRRSHNVTQVGTALLRTTVDSLTLHRCLL